MSGLRGRYLRNTSWMLMSRVVRLAVAFGIGVITARYLGKDTFGELSYLISFVMLFGALGTLGLDDILVRELEASPEDEGEILGTALVLRIAGSLVLTAAALGTGACLGLGGAVLRLMLPVCAFQLLQSEARTFERRFEAGVQAKWSSIAQTLAIAASLVTSVALIVARASMPAFLAVKVVESAVLLVALAAFHRQIGGTRSFRFAKARAIGLVRAGLPLMLTGTFLLIYMRIDQVMIRHFLDDGAVGCYAAAVRLSEAWYFVPSVIAASFFPAILRARREDAGRYRARLQVLYETMTWLGIGVALPVTLCSGWIVRLLYGAEYAPAGPVLALYVWAGVFVFQSVVRSKWVVAENLQRYALVFTALATTVNVVLNAILIPRVGLTGAALATVVSCVCQSIVVPALFAPTRPSAWAIVRSFVPVHLLREGIALAARCVEGDAPLGNSCMIAKLKKLLLLFSPSDWIRFALILLMMLAAAVFELVGLGAIPAFVMMLAQPDALSRYPAVERAFGVLGAQTRGEILLVGSLVLIGIFALRTLYLVLNYYLQDRIIRNRQIELSHRLFAAYMTAPYEFHLRRNSAELLRNATQEVERTVAEALNPMLNVVRQGIVMVAVVGIVIYVEPAIGICALVLIGCAGLGFLSFVNGRMRWAGELEQAMRGEQYRTVNEGLSVFKELKVMGRERGLTRRFHASAETMARPQRLRDTARRSTWPAMEFIVVTGLLLVAVFMIRSGRDLAALMPTLALFTVALGRLKGCATEFVSALTQVRYNLASADVVADDLAELGGKGHVSVPDPAAPLPLRPDSVLALSHVTFRYLPDRPPVLRDVSLRIRRGSCIGLVGPTGSGKSTILDLIMGVLQPDEGEILLDGEDIQSRLRSWQACIGYIPQQITLLDDSVSANIALGVLPKERDDAAVESAVAAAHLQETIRGLPDGLQTVVGERGVRLSGGQRQRIAIARALYHQPELLIMDEGTSSLDAETERAVVESVHALKGQRTIIMVAHRLNTVRECETIFYVNGGRIEAQGSYEELRRSHAGFRRMTDGE